MKLVFNAICIALLLSFSACEKEGAQGPQGEQGLPGAAGSQGIKGENGSTILSGTTDPSSAIGKDGDFYLNLNSKKLFGPKKSGNWGTAIELNGKDGLNGQNGQNGQNGADGLNGTNGTNGNTILSGNGIPSYYSGNIGDFYIDLSKMDFYGPLTSNGWGSPISLKGNSTLQKRVLIKEYFDYSRNCDACSVYSTTWTPGYSTYSSTTAEVFINVGDIQQYYSNGIVTYEARINGGEWFVLDPSYKKEIIKQYQVSNREYLMMFMPASFQYYPNSGKLFIGSYRMVSILGTYSQNQLMSYLDAEMKVDIRITLLPKESIEYLSKSYPNQKINDSFVSRYFGMSDR
ncbi:MULTISPECIES: collagen-like protein [unclassified Sphingobacterium]|uniref:collagen-like triple helix repeat-containing protein n=1 Tax=unclassified Sphingobacterium TaxID=2609468 RepID=UPI0020C42AFE|nr:MULTISPECIES: collagen-like protein [unclassified Sphingobacterium]